MSSRILVLLLLCLSFGAGSTQAQRPCTLQAGPERSAILNAARPNVAADLGYRGRVQFVVDCLLVSGDWALLQARPQTPSGTELHMSCPGADELTLVLLKRSHGVWQRERGGTTCATDVFWEAWVSDTGAPAEIFAANESNCDTQVPPCGLENRSKGQGTSSASTGVPTRKSVDSVEQQLEAEDEH